MSATRPIGVDGEDAVKRQLEALANGECDHVAFLEAMKERFRFEPDENWEALSLLDQYYRRGKIPLDVYRAIKNGFAEYILGPQVAMPTLNKVAARVPAAPAAAPAAAAAARTTPAAPQPSAPSAAPSAAQAAPAKVQPAAVTPPELTPAPTFTGTPAPSLTGSLAPAFTGGATQPAATNARASAAPLREVGEDVLRDRYRIESVVARGSSGTVYEVTDAYRLNLPPSGKRLALKMPRTPDARGNSLSQLRHEFQQLQHLSHPNIVRAFDFDRDGALSFFTMELLSGVHLPEVLQGKGAQPLPRAHALAIIQALGSAIAYAHSRSVVHGDINPQNVFITMAGEIRLLGFGAAHKLSAAAPNPEFERASAAPDTHRYASCEVFEGNRPTVPDDIYSLSCVAYLLLKGRHPYGDTTSIEARATRLRPSRPRGLSYHQWRTLRAGLSTDANKRPDSAQDWLEGMALGVAPPPRLPAANELIEARPDKPRRLTWLAAVVVIAALIGVGYWYSMSSGTFSLSPLSRQLANEDLAAPDTSEPPTMATVPTTTAPTAPAAPASVPPASAPTPAVTQQRTTAAASQPAVKSMTPSSQRPAAAPTPAVPAPSAAAASAATGATVTRNTAGANTSAAVPAASATASAARSGGVPRVEMAVDTLDAAPTDTAVHVTVRRKGNLHGVTSFTWWTESGTAKPGVDFSPVLPHVAQMQDGEASTELTVPLLSTVRAQPKGFYVGIESTDGGAQIGARALTQITLPPTN